MFAKGQTVELTQAGLNLIRLDSDGNIRKHRNGKLFASTGVVLAVNDSEWIVVRLSSKSKSSTGDSYESQYWQVIDDKTTQCYLCQRECDQNGVFRELVRGPRQGQRIGPLCMECEQDMEERVLFTRSEKFVCAVVQDVEKPIHKPLKNQQTLPFEPDYSTPPGWTIRDVLEYRGLTHLEAAREMCGATVTPNAVQENLELIKRSILQPDSVIEISEEMAGRLAVIVASKGFWLNLFRNHNRFLMKAK